MEEKDIYTANPMVLKSVKKEVLEVIKNILKDLDLRAPIDPGSNFSVPIDVERFVNRFTEALQERIDKLDE